MLIHTIAAENGFKNLNASSRMNAEWDFLLHLHEVGRRVADDWLEENFDAIGQRSTLDLNSILIYLIRAFPPLLHENRTFMHPGGPQGHECLAFNILQLSGRWCKIYAGTLNCSKRK